MLRLRSNCSVIFVEPSELVDDILSMPAIVENSFSSGVATEDAMVSGLAPGNAAWTWMVGYSTVGRSLTGRPKYERTPNTRMAAINNVVVTLRRMKKSVMRISRSLSFQPQDRRRQRLLQMANSA